MPGMTNRTFDFAHIERVTTDASRHAVRADAKAACEPLTKLAPADKIRAVRAFIERDRRRRASGKGGDWVGWTFAQGALGPREVLPWSRDDVAFVLAAVGEEPVVLPPELTVRVVRQFAAAHVLDTELRRGIERAAKAMWPDEQAEGAAFKKAARDLRALVGAPGDDDARGPEGLATKEAPKAPARPREPSPKPASKKPATRRASASFAARVRHHMATALPRYRFVETSGGSGPLVTFDRPAPAAMAHLRERVVFQKGLHGASWFRVNFFPVLEGPSASGRSEHTLSEGAKLGRDVSYAADADLEAALTATCAALEPEARKFFAPFEKRYAALETLFGDLVSHYARFLREAGAKLAARDFVEDAGGEIAAFRAFLRHLAKRKLWVRDARMDLETALWRFWHAGRPMRETDYRKGDYYECTRCASFVAFSRGRLVPKRIAGFGTHYAFVCRRHGGPRQ